KNWTLVVTTTGTSQFSLAIRLRGVSRSGSMAEWCSTIASCPSAASYTPAFCSMMLVYGMTATTFCSPCFTACSRANAIAASVFPPPVGIVRLKRPGGSTARFHQVVADLSHDDFSGVEAHPDREAQSSRSLQILRVAPELGVQMKGRVTSA